ncbi:MAG: HlyD family secretion protein [Pirellulales bacterium]
MEDLPRIPIPLSQQWLRLRFQVLPPLIFAASAVLVVWLWGGHVSLPNSLGEANSLQVDMASRADGILVSLPSSGGTDGLKKKDLEIFDTVLANQVIARLDERPVLAALAALQSDLSRLAKELEATAETTRLDDEDRKLARVTELRRLLVEVNQRRLDVLDRKTQLEVDRIGLQVAEEQYDIQRGLYDRKIITRLDILNAELARDTAKKKVEDGEKAVAEAELQKKDAEDLKSYPTELVTNTEKLLAPYRAALVTQEAKIRELELQRQSLEIRAPISGIVSAIHRRPGQAVRAGDPILTVSDNRPQYIISYIRQEQRIQPVRGMLVDVRVRSIPTRTFETKIEDIGPQVEAVPSHQLRDSKVPEWGLPVHIAMPEGATLRPGELVDITFKPWQSDSQENGNGAG